ncbi:hypothetical protein [Pseudodesulfovibrio indicus]|uniref:Glycosyl transferase n=1 Tax=Pseudodesulfovibrio indicus TaxID=1716143 RepID=A0AA94PR99_9BACT|nr:hypothetical protein [Pseudodesulfovibrio indicus]TDT92054.1 hypothetical protein EDC59_101458 [Pseudodesulfovibrio indicus]
MIRVYSSFTKAYLPKARTLAKSLKALHPDWVFHAVFSDSLPEDFDLDAEPFDEMLGMADIGIEDSERWAFRHTVVELCTAVKGAALQHLLSLPDTDCVFYIDPDIMILNSMAPLVDMLEDASILLTPHMLEPEEESWLIEGNEVRATLAHGTFNLGFAGVRACDEGKAFARWWNRRLLEFCYDDVPRGLFTDQRWCDLVPSFFPGYKIVRDPGYNVATWNIDKRPITRGEDGRYRAGDVPLRFYHFTGYDAQWNYQHLLLKHAEQFPAAKELWDEYASALEENGQNDEKLKHWKYDWFADGHKITPECRRHYRDNEKARKDFPDPYSGKYREHCAAMGFLGGKRKESIIEHLGYTGQQIRYLFVLLYRRLLKGK